MFFGPLLALSITTPAAAQTAWTAPEDMTFASYAIMPDPEPGTPVSGGILVCEEQVWTLSLAVRPGETLVGAEGRATLTARGVPFSVESTGGSGTVDLNVPYQALEPMKAGVRLHIEFEGERRPIRFPLTGSRRAITAVEDACSARELPTENLVELQAGSPWLELGRRLRADDIRDFVVSTNDLPDLRVAMMDLEGARQLFFVEICGSSWYYGVSGCNIAGFARIGGGSSPNADTEGWEQVFESEGVHVYTVPGEFRDGWPDLIAVPLKPGSADKLWAWAGQRYAVQGSIQAELRTGQ
ncbi:MAG: hypothetical protein JJ913_12340 [Rhizobiaceae bacterium]|nr:hypothetical protein [Rhizobiaceae bacterium]